MASGRLLVGVKAVRVVAVMATLASLVVVLPSQSVESVGGGPATPVVQVSAGCAVLSGGIVKCWGYNTNGRLGLGDTLNRGDQPGEMGDALPAVDLGTGRTATAVASDFYHACALLDGGAVKCWGRNDSGQLGLGDAEDRGDSPGEMGDSLATVDLGTGRTAVELELGLYHTCALLDDGSVKCWGVGGVALGLGDFASRGDQPGEMGDALLTVDLGTGRTATAIAAGNTHTCAVLDDGSMKCWGSNGDGRLGLGDTQHRGGQSGQMGDALPTVDLGTGRTAIGVVAGERHTCALLDDASVKCWGANFIGQLGLGDTKSRGDQPGEMGDALPAVELGSGRSAVSVSLAYKHTCALLDDASVKCWGQNASGLLGLGDTNHRGDQPGEMGDALPAVDFGSGLSALGVATGQGFACVLLDDASVKCWGINFSGQLGLGDVSHRGDGPGEMGDNLPVVDLGLGALPELDPCDGVDLVTCYAPHVLFHPDEDFYPMDVNDFVNGSVLMWQGCRGSEMLVNANPTPESLRLHAAHSWDTADEFWDVVAVGLGGQFYCRPTNDSRLFTANEFTRLDKEQANNGADRATVVGEPGGELLDLGQGFFLDWEDGKAAGVSPQPNPVPLVGRFIDAPVYFEQSDEQITYWFFYGYDPKADWSWDDIDVIWDRYGIPHLGIGDINPIGIFDGVTAHQGDWEHITIDLGTNGRPTHVSYAGHGCDEKQVPWSDVDTTDGTHPHVYVAEGSHASYPDEIDLGGTYCTDYPAGQADVTEFNQAASVAWQTWTGIGTKPLGAECWYGFGGAWGDHRHIDTLLEPLSGHASGPVGPPYNSGIGEGQDPLTTSACRPAWWMGSPVEEAVLNATYEWGDFVALGFEDGTPNGEVVFTLNSLPIEVARGTVDASGSLQVAFEIPDGTPPGPHRLVGQDAQSGTTFYVATFWLDAPADCLADGYPSAGDVDGDLVRDTCDPSLIDGRDADFDGDGVNNGIDNCPTIANPDQDTAFDGRAVGSACDERLGVNTTEHIVETDQNPPTIAITVDPPLNPAGWANTGVVVTAECIDVEGPVASCSHPVVVDTEGAGQIVSLRAVDAVANETVVDVVVSIDTTMPTVDIVGIDNGAVVFAHEYEPPSCVASDTLSGLNGSCTVIVEETTTSPGTAGFRATASASDLAGNTTVKMVDYVVVYDTDAPTVTVMPSLQPNAAGWFNEPVTYSFECDDASGVATCPAPVTVSTEGADQAFTVTASDVLGNTAEIVHSGINIDRTAPTIEVAAPTTVEPADTVTISCSTTDVLSGLADTNCATVQVDATSLAPGPNTFAFAATDRAGNTATTTTIVNLNVDVGGIAELIAQYLGDTPGAGGQLNALTHKLTNGDINGFTNHVWAQCCTPTKQKRFTYDQATILVTLVATLP